MGQQGVGHLHPPGGLRGVRELPPHERRPVRPAGSLHGRTDRSLCRAQRGSDRDVPPAAPQPRDRPRREAFHLARCAGYDDLAEHLQRAEHEYGDRCAESLGRRLPAAPVDRAAPPLRGERGVPLLTLEGPAEAGPHDRWCKGRLEPVPARR